MICPAIAVPFNERLIRDPDRVTPKVKNRTYAKTRGYTLLEIFIAVALLSIILAVAFPSLSEFVDRRRVVANGQEISDLLSAARQQAVAINQRIRVCWNEQGEDTTNTRNVAGHLIPHGGFIVVNRADQSILYRTSNLSGSRSVFRESVRGRCMIYETDGRTNNKGGAFFVCAANGDDDGAVQVRIDIAGRAQIVREVPAGTC